MEFVSFASYPQPFKILLNPLRQFGGFLVEVLDFDVDVAEGLFEIEVVIDFRRGNSDVAAGREAPVGGGDFSARRMVRIGTTAMSRHAPMERSMSATCATS